MTKQHVSRITFVTWLFCLLGVLFVAKLFYIQIIRHSWYQALAEGKFSALEEQRASLRGDILARDGGDELEAALLATNQKLFLVFAEPKRVSGERHAAAVLSKGLGLDEKELVRTLTDPDDTYAPLKHFVSEETVNFLKGQNLEGIGFSPEMKRLYPYKDVFGSLTGFLGYRASTRVGQYGLEEEYENVLSGSSLGDVVQEGGASVAADMGSSIVTSLNKTVQQQACKFLESGVTATESARGSLIVIEPDTGLIKALCAFPSYDPNVYNETDPALFRNPVITESYEPGSVFKPITMAAAIDSGAVEPSTIHEDTGSVKFGKFTIRNADNKVYGKVTMTQVLEESINTGVMFAVHEMGMPTFDRAVRAFGFGKKSGIDFPSESPGNVSSLGKHKEIYSATGSFGQGITVTPLQIARAYSAIANKGYLPVPRIIEAYRSNGVETQLPIEKPIQVLSARTADIVSAMLASVVNVGHSKGAAVPGYFVAGKTGTAQIANEGEEGYSEETNHTFAGFFPLSRPRFVVVVMMEKPKVGRFAESTAVPVFRNIVEFLLQYYKIPPDRPNT